MLSLWCLAILAFLLAFTGTKASCTLYVTPTEDWSNKNAKVCIRTTVCGPSYCPPDACVAIKHATGSICLPYKGGRCYPYHPLVTLDVGQSFELYKRSFLGFEVRGWKRRRITASLCATGGKQAFWTTFWRKRLFGRHYGVGNVEVRVVCNAGENAGGCGNFVEGSRLV